MATNISTYFGHLCVSHPEILHKNFIYAVLDNSLIDESVGTPDVYVNTMIARNLKTGHNLSFDRMPRKTVYAVLKDNVPPVLASILGLAEYLKAKAESVGKQLSDLMQMKGFELHSLIYECDTQTIIDGALVKYNKDFTKKLVDVKYYSLEDMLFLTASDMYFGLKADEKLASDDYATYTKSELEAMTKADLTILRIAIENATGAELGVTDGSLKDDIVTAILKYLGDE